MSNIYCGARDPPKGKRLGSMKECAEKGQISYYGVKKVDSRLLEAMRKPKKKSKAKFTVKEFEKVGEERGQLQAKVRKMEKQIEVERSSKKKKELQAEHAKLKKKLIDVVKRFDEINKSLKRMTGRKLSRSSKSKKSATSKRSKRSKRSTKRSSKK